ncbi:MAG: PilZ domain-containing protein [Planctomycetes bacterium]|nr:PilZ domain-containing protein [Planctomycetota bacterium]
MSSDPWSRPTIKDLQQVLESIERNEVAEGRDVERLELSVPAEMTTSRGNTISTMTREISRNGIGLLHRGSVSLGEVTVRMASETRQFEYRVLIEWCSPCENGMFISGGRFLRNTIEEPTL